MVQKTTTHPTCPCCRAPYLETSQPHEDRDRIRNTITSNDIEQQEQEVDLERHEQQDHQVSS